MLLLCAVISLLVHVLMLLLLLVSASPSSCSPGVITNVLQVPLVSFVDLRQKRSVDRATVPQDPTSALPVLAAGFVHAAAAKNLGPSATVSQVFLLIHAATA